MGVHKARVSIVYQERDPPNRDGKPIGLTRLVHAVGWRDYRQWFKQYSGDETDPRNYFKRNITWESAGYGRWLDTGFAAAPNDMIAG